MPKEVITVVQDVVGDLATDAVQRAAAGAAARNAARVAGLQHAVVAVVVREQARQRQVRGPRAAAAAPRRAGNAVPTPARVVQRVVSQRMPAEQEILLGVNVQRIQVVAGIVNFIDQTIVHRVTVAAEINAGAGV